MISVNLKVIKKILSIIFCAKWNQNEWMNSLEGKDSKAELKKRWAIFL